MCESEEDSLRFRMLSSNPKSGISGWVLKVNGYQIYNQFQI